MPLKITQLDVARVAKIHPSTVCLALANKPNIAEATKLKVQAVAKKLGYVRDPMMAALAAYRRTRRAPAFHGLLGWVFNSKSHTNWLKTPQFVGYFEGAKERAAELGYKFESFDLADYVEHPDRLASILRARDVRGILICPASAPDGKLKLDVAQLSVVALGYSIREPRFNLVTSHHYTSITEVIQNLRARGYRKIGYVIPTYHDRNIDQNCFAAYLVQRETWPPSEHVPRYTGEQKAAPFLAWLRKYKPDAVVLPHYFYPRLLSDLKIKVPEKLGAAVVSLVADPDLAGFAGIDEESHEIGRIATALLASSIERGERGAPSHPQRVLVAGVWKDGRTLRPLPINAS